MVHIIVRKFGHYADIVTIYLQKHGKADYLFIYIIQLVQHLLSGLATHSGLKIYGDQKLTKWLTVFATKML